jgi:hypothetical protein
MCNDKCHGCDDPEPEDVLTIMEFRLCHSCRDYGTMKKISPLILTKGESLAIQKDFELKEHRNGANVFGEFCVVSH